MLVYRNTEINVEPPGGCQPSLKYDGSEWTLRANPDTVSLFSLGYAMTQAKHLEDYMGLMVTPENPMIFVLTEPLWQKVEGEYIQGFSFMEGGPDDEGAKNNC